MNRYKILTAAFFLLSVSCSLLEAAFFKKKPSETKPAPASEKTSEKSSKRSRVSGFLKKASPFKKKSTTPTASRKTTAKNISGPTLAAGSASPLSRAQMEQKHLGKFSPTLDKKGQILREKYTGSASKQAAIAGLAAGVEGMKQKQEKMGKQDGKIELLEKKIDQLQANLALLEEENNKGWGEWLTSFVNPSEERQQIQKQILEERQKINRVHGRIMSILQEKNALKQALQADEAALEKIMGDHQQLKPQNKADFGKNQTFNTTVAGMKQDMEGMQGHDSLAKRLQKAKEGQTAKDTGAIAALAKNVMMKVAILEKIKQVSMAEIEKYKKKVAVVKEIGDFMHADPTIARRVKPDKPKWRDLGGKLLDTYQPGAEDLLTPEERKTLSPEEKKRLAQERLAEFMANYRPTVDGAQAFHRFLAGQKKHYETTIEKLMNIVNEISAKVNASKAKYSKFFTDNYAAYKQHLNAKKAIHINSAVEIMSVINEIQAEINLKKNHPQYKSEVPALEEKVKALQAKLTSVKNKIEKKEIQKMLIKDVKKQTALSSEELEKNKLTFTKDKTSHDINDLMMAVVNLVQISGKQAPTIAGKKIYDQISWMYGGSFLANTVAKAGISAALSVLVARLQTMMAALAEQKGAKLTGDATQIKLLVALQEYTATLGAYETAKTPELKEKLKAQKAHIKTLGASVQQEVASHSVGTGSNNITVKAQQAQADILEALLQVVDSSPEIVTDKAKEFLNKAARRDDAGELTVAGWCFEKLTVGMANALIPVVLGGVSGRLKASLSAIPEAARILNQDTLNSLKERLTTAKDDAERAKINAQVKELMENGIKKFEAFKERVTQAGRDKTTEHDKPAMKDIKKHATDYLGARHEFRQKLGS